MDQVSTFEVATHDGEASAADAQTEVSHAPTRTIPQVTPSPAAVRLAQTVVMRIDNVAWISLSISHI